MNVKLGRRPAVHNRRTMLSALAMARALDPLGTPPRISNDYVSAVLKASPGGFEMFLNDKLGDCVCADSAHQVMLHTANSGTIVIPTDQDVIALYEAVGGYDPSQVQPDGSNPTDQGCAETDMCQYMMTTGLCGQKSAGTASVAPGNNDHIAWCVQLFGACRLGIEVTDDMINDFSSGQPWTNMSGNVMGGHDVPIVKYDGTYAYVVTWGQLQPVSWTLLQNTDFLQEAHASVDPDFINATGVAPSGFRLAELLAALPEVA
jgi:hypothetical protein